MNKMLKCEMCGKAIENRDSICDECISKFMEDKLEKYTTNNREVMKITNIWGSTLEVNDEYVMLEHLGIESIKVSIPKIQKILYYDDITSVKFKYPDFKTYGYIQFNVSWHIPQKEPLYDEYTFAISKKNEDSAKELYDKIIEKKRKYAKGKISIVIQVSSANEIKKFKNLFDEGVITEKEFEEKKKQLLNL